MAGRQKLQLDQRFALAMRAARMGSWSWDIASGRVEWDAHTSELFGLERSAFAGTFEAWGALVHPDDREWVSDEIATRSSSAGRSGSTIAACGPTVRSIGSKPSARWCSTVGARSSARPA